MVVLEVAKHNKVMKPDLSKPLEDLSYPVDPSFHRCRLDRFLAAKLSWRSRSGIRGLLEAGRILVNDSTFGLKMSRKVLFGDRVRVLIPKPRDGEIHHDTIPLDIIYEDDSFLALNKQPGIICHPVSRNLYNTLINALHHRYRRMDDPTKDILPRLAHRLDKDTSGVLLVAKSARMRSIFQKMIERSWVKKTYQTIVHGVIQDDEGRIDSPIGKDPSGRSKIMMAVREDGVRSLTTYRVVNRFSAHTHVEVRLHTGRTHQIRVHMKSIGHPVCGDPLYGVGTEPGRTEGIPAPPRLCLHALRVQLTHPVSGEEVTIGTNLPADLLDFLGQLTESDTGRAPSSDLTETAPPS